MSKIWLNIIFSSIFVLFASQVKGNSPLEVQAQLEINKTTLLSAASADNMKVNAAVLLLINKDEQARLMLLNILADVNNPSARIAVCNAIRQSSVWNGATKKDIEYVDMLIEMLGSSDKNEPKAAAEAMMAYNYGIVDSKIQKIISNPKESINKRLNAVYALTLRYEKEAIIDIIGLIDFPQKDISEFAEKSLQKSLGIPSGLDKKEWKKISKELSRKNKDEFLADQLVSQYDKCKKLETELSDWKTLFLGIIDKYYEKGDNEALEIEFLSEQLTSTKPELRLWAVSKVLEWADNGKTIPDKIGSQLVGLINDSNSKVRLEVAQLLVGLSKLGPAEKLLSQILVEKDGQVRIEQLRALGEAVYYGSSPGASIKTESSLRLKALEIAQEYLQSSVATESGVGAKQMRKMLENSGLDAKIYDKYLAQISGRFAETHSQSDSQLRADLVESMSKLCGENSSCRLDAIKLYKDIFLAGLNDVDPLVRQFSLSGVVNSEGVAAAIGYARSKSMYNDENAGVRTDVVLLAQKSGSQEDLVWLVNMINVNGLSEIVWNAITDLLARSSVQNGYEFYKIIKNMPTANQSQIKQVLLVLEQKSVSENNFEIGKLVFEELFVLYLNNGDYESVKGLIAEKLKSVDTTDGDFELVSIDNFLNNDKIGLSIKVDFIGKLGSIAIENRPNWSKNLSEIQNRFKALREGVSGQVDEPNKAG